MLSAPSLSTYSNLLGAWRLPTSYQPFDGASNVQQAAGAILAVDYPSITLAHGAEHVVSLFFEDVFTLFGDGATIKKIPMINALGETTILWR